MLVEESFESSAEVFSDSETVQITNIELVSLLQRYERIQSKLSVIADEVPTDEFDVDAMITRERKLFDEKNHVLTSLSEMSVRSERDAKTVFNVLKDESLSDGVTGSIMIGRRTVRSFQDLMSDRFC